MDIVVANLLTFCEETLIHCLEKFEKVFPVLIEEIPENERNKKCPIRFKMTIDQAKLKKPNNNRE